MIRYHFHFKTTVPFKDIDGNLTLFALAAECIHGRNRVRLEAPHDSSKEDHSCWIDAMTDVGEHLALMYSGMMAFLFGERSFTVKREVIVAKTVAPQKGVAA